MTAISGRKCAELLPLAGLDGSLARMCRALMTASSWASTECFLTWKDSATTRSRLKFRLVPSMPRTGGPGSGLWPTADTPNGGRGIGHAEQQGGTFYDKTGKKVQLSLENAAKLWPTMHGGGNTDKTGKVGGGCELSMVAAHPELRNAERLWATPTSHERTHTPRQVDHGAQLANEAAIGLTPTSSTGGALNPEFVCWLMGYPDGWLDLEPSEMPSSRRSPSGSGGPS